jgi:hypothetical protein
MIVFIGRMGDMGATSRARNAGEALALALDDRNHRRRVGDDRRVAAW